MKPDVRVCLSIDVFDEDGFEFAFSVSMGQNTGRLDRGTFHVASGLSGYHLLLPYPTAKLIHRRAAHNRENMLSYISARRDVVENEKRRRHLVETVPSREHKRSRKEYNAFDMARFSF